MRIVSALAGVCFAHAANAPPTLAQSPEGGNAANGGSGSSAAVVHMHGGRPLRRVKTDPPSPSGERWRFDLHGGASHTSVTGPFATGDEQTTFADLYATTGGKKLGLHYQTDKESGRFDTTVGASLALPVTSRINASFEADFSLDRVFNPDYSVRLGGSSTLYYDAASETYAALSLSTQVEGFEYGESLSFNPSLIVGVSTGVVLTVGYTFGNLIDATSAPATALSQASYTEGWSIGATLSPTEALSLDFLFLPKNRTVLNASETTETTFRGGVDYSFSKRFQAGLAAELATTSAPVVGHLYDSVKYEGSVKLSF